MKTGMKPELLDRMVCPQCGRAITLISDDKLKCGYCRVTVSVERGKPIFTPVPSGMQAAPKLERGPAQGSTWRQANWAFLEKIVDALPLEAVILDFGAGHGDFSQVLKKRSVIALDVYPYDEIDLVCDMQKIVPFRKACFDAIVLMNVLEHVQHPEILLKVLAGLLQPGGSLVITVPFLLKLHQLPYDFARYSHYQLKNIGLAAGLEINHIEAFYDPYLLMNESAISLSAYSLPGLPFITRKLSRILLVISSWFASAAGGLSGKGHVGDPLTEKNPYPIGYHVVFGARNGKKKQNK